MEIGVSYIGCLDCLQDEVVQEDFLSRVPLFFVTHTFFLIPGPELFNLAPDSPCLFGPQPLFSDPQPSFFHFDPQPFFLLAFIFQPFISYPHPFFF